MYFQFFNANTHCLRMPLSQFLQPLPIYPHSLPLRHRLRTHFLTLSHRSAIAHPKSFKEEKAPCLQNLGDNPQLEQSRSHDLPHKTQYSAHSTSARTTLTFPPPSSQPPSPTSPTISLHTPSPYVPPAQTGLLTRSPGELSRCCSCRSRAPCRLVGPRV